MPEEEEKKSPTTRTAAVAPRSRGFRPWAVFGGPPVSTAVLFPSSSDDPILSQIPLVVRNPPVQRNFPRYPFTPPTPSSAPSDSPPSLVSSSPPTPPTSTAPPILDFAAAARADSTAPSQWALPLPPDMNRQMRSRIARDFNPAPDGAPPRSGRSPPASSSTRPRRSVFLLDDPASNITPWPQFRRRIVRDGR